MGGPEKGQLLQVTKIKKGGPEKGRFSDARHSLPATLEW